MNASGFLTDHRRFALNTFLALGSLSLSALGLYFVYRWGVTIKKVDDATRRLLLGDLLAPMMGNLEVLQVVVALYLGFKFFMLMVTAADWERFLEHDRRKLRHFTEKKSVVAAK